MKKSIFVFLLSLSVVLHLDSVLLGQANFTCGNSIVDASGNTYQTVAVGGQCWTMRNLTTSKYRNGVDIPEVPGADWPAFTTGAWSKYANNGANNVVYGKLYNWHAITNQAGICPTGWKVPTLTDWNDLITHLGGMNVAGGKLKSTGTDFWTAPNTGATNSSQLGFLPGGHRHFTEGFFNIGRTTFLWTSTTVALGYSYAFALSHDLASIGLSDYFQHLNGAYARCIYENTQTSIDFDNEDRPNQLRLDQNYPNPFNPSTSITFGLPKQTFVQLEVYSAQGQLVDVLFSGMKAQGNHTIEFTSKNLSSGVYLIRLSTLEESITSKMLLVK